LDDGDTISVGTLQQDDFIIFHSRGVGFDQEAVPDDFGLVSVTGSFANLNCYRITSSSIPNFLAQGSSSWITDIAWCIVRQSTPSASLSALYISSLSFVGSGNGTYPGISFSGTGGLIIYGLSWFTGDSSVPSSDPGTLIQGYLNPSVSLSYPGEAGVRLYQASLSSPVASSSFGWTGTSHNWNTGTIAFFTPLDGGGDGGEDPGGAAIRPLRRIQRDDTSFTPRVAGVSGNMPTSQQQSLRRGNTNTYW
jgi:hypothetical protein